jgi:pyruvate dehydrogenase E1 component
MYRLASHGEPGAGRRVRLLGSGAILREVTGAADLLLHEFGVTSEVFSVTSFCELARDAAATQRHNRLHPADAPQLSYLDRCLSGSAPIIAATDYVRAYPELIAAHVNARFVALGTDGFGRSDTRAALREFFEVNREHIVIAALSALVAEGQLDRDVWLQAMRRFGIDGCRPAPWTV